MQTVSYIKYTVKHHVNAKKVSIKKTVETYHANYGPVFMQLHFINTFKTYINKLL